MTLRNQRSARSPPAVHVEGGRQPPVLLGVQRESRRGTEITHGYCSDTAKLTSEPLIAKKKRNASHIKRQKPPPQTTTEAARAMPCTFTLPIHPLNGQGGTRTSVRLRTGRKLALAVPQLDRSHHMVSTQLFGSSETTDSLSLTHHTHWLEMSSVRPGMSRELPKLLFSLQHLSTERTKL